MTRLIKKAARTTDARFFTPVFDDNKKLIPFQDWLNANKDTIAYRLKNFILFYYVNKKRFVALDYLNNVVKGKNKKRFYEKIVTLVLNDPRLFDRKLSAKCINLPKEYMKNDKIDKSMLKPFLKDIMLSFYDVDYIDKEEQWATLDQEFRAGRDDDDLTRIKSPEVSTALKERMLTDLETRLSNTNFLNKLKQQNVTSIEQITNIAIDEILNREPRFNGLFYGQFKFSLPSFSNTRFMKLFTELLNESAKTDKFISKATQVLERLIKEATFNLNLIKQSRLLRKS